MDRNDESSRTLLQDNLRLLALLLAKFEQREARMQESMDRNVRALQQEVAQAERRFDGIAVATAARIAEEARGAVATSVRGVEQAAGEATHRLRGAGRMVWAWYGGLAGLAVVLCVAAWLVLGYYRRELHHAQDELARYEGAIPVVRAYYASDALLCGERLCINVDPAVVRQGKGRRYRVARPRPDAGQQ